MPLYEYRCDKCNTVQEHMFSIKDFPRELPCTVCDSNAHKIISKNTFVLAGGGWASDGYVTNMEKFKTNMKAVDNY